MSDFDREAITFTVFLSMTLLALAAAMHGFA